MSLESSPAICPSCGQRRLANDQRCIECDVALVAAERIPDPPTLEDDDEQVAFEFGDWPDRAFETLTRVLDFQEIDHRWDDGTLYVPGADEERATTVVDQVKAALEEVAEARAARSADADGEDGLGDGDQIAYELDEWANESKVALDGMLTSRGIAHVWEAGTLVVRAGDEEAVDALVEEIEVTQQPTLDPDADQVVYEIEGFSDVLRSELERALIADEVPHGWDEDGNLVVLEEDQDRAGAILDRVDDQRDLTADDVREDGEDEGDDEDDDGDGDGEDEDEDEGDGGFEDDGMAAQDAMSAMFVAVDKLMKSPDDKKEQAALVRAHDQLKDLRVPYGFTTAAWTSIKERSALLVALVQPDDDEAELDVAQAKADARALREELHQYL